MKMQRGIQLLTAHLGLSMMANLPAQQNYGHSKTDNWNRMAGTEQPMSIIHLAHTFWQRSGGFLTALASWRSHGQWAKLSHVHAPATDSGSTVRTSFIHITDGQARRQSMIKQKNIEETKQARLFTQ
jgi:hypothetical protein